MVSEEVILCGSLDTEQSRQRRQQMQKLLNRQTGLIWMKIKTSTGKNKVGKTFCYKRRERPV